MKLIGFTRVSTRQQSTDRQQDRNASTELRVRRTPPELRPRCGEPELARRAGVPVVDTASRGPDRRLR